MAMSVSLNAVLDWEKGRNTSEPVSAGRTGRLCTPAVGSDIACTAAETLPWNRSAI